MQFLVLVQVLGLATLAHGQFTVIRPLEIIANEGQSAVFACSPFVVVALPTVQIRRPGESVFTNIPPTDLRLSFVDFPAPNDPTNRTYSYSNVQRSEHGTLFSCIVNGVPAEEPGTLTVNFPPSYADPGVQTVEEGQDITVLLTLESRPSDLTTGTLTRAGGASVPSDTTFNAVSVTFIDVERGDAGQYTLTSSNAVGEGSVSFTLDVLFSPTPSPSSPSPTVSSAVVPAYTPVKHLPKLKQGGVGGDPHYSVLLPTGQLLCYSVHGEKGFSFNLISNKLMHMNALFVQDPVRAEITWISSLGIVVRNTPYKKSNVTKLRFEAEEKIYIGDAVALQVQKIERLAFRNGKLMISESSRTRGDKRPEVYVDLQDVGLSFKVRFTKSKHLDLSWDRVVTQPTDSHGMIGQFFRDGIEIDEPRKLLLLPTLDPVPVMRKPVWHFMEREVPEDQLCWVAMNPGYQGKRLIEGHYLDYLVNDVLSGDFKFEAKEQKL